MLTPAWYLTDGDYFNELPTQPPLDDMARLAIHAVEQLFGDEGEFSESQMIAATRVALRAAEHLHDEITHNARGHNTAEVVRLLQGLNLLQAHLTQTIHKLADHVDQRTFPGLADLHAATVKTAVGSLRAAGIPGEDCAGHLKDAHRTLRSALK